MSDPIQEQLLGHLLGALDPAEEDRVVARLRIDGELRGQLGRVQEWLEPLQAGRYGFEPPAGLAERTCRAVALHAEPSAAVRQRPMIPVAAAPAEAGRFRWVDVAAAAGFIAAASLLLMPAIQSSRFNARLLACQNNLRQIGVGMIQYSEHHSGYFPCMPLCGGLTVAGIYGPVLVHDGLVTESRTFVCPASPLAGRAGFRILSLDEIQTVSQDKLRSLVRSMSGSYVGPLGYIRDGVYQRTRNLGRSAFALVADEPSEDPSNGRQSLNHGGRGQNVLFEGGGVRFFTLPRPFPQADDIYVNDYNLVDYGAHVNDAVVAPSAAWPSLVPVAQ